MKKSFFSWLLIGLFFSHLCLAQDKEINLGPLTVAQLEELYQFYNYQGERGYLQVPGYYYPPIFLSSFPTDFNQITDEKKRNALFFKILAPLTLKLNQNIKMERNEIIVLEQAFRTNQDLTTEQTDLLEAKATKYDIFTRLKGHQRLKHILKELLIKVDEIPSSFLIANAAIATNYGTSRIVSEGNALFKELSWHQDSGLKPQGETEDDSYRIKTYPNLYSAMEAFSLRLNSSISFEHMRDMRKNLRYRGSLVTGTTFAYSLMWNLPLKNFAGMLEYTIAFYELNIIDKSLLNSNLIEKPLPNKMKGIVTKL